MNWFDQFISENKKKKESKNIEKNIRNILALGGILFLMTSMFTILNKVDNSLVLLVSNRLDRDVLVIIPSFLFLIIFLLMLFLISYSVIVIVYYRDTKKLDIHVSLIEILRKENVIKSN